jgi:hypothetical protein
MEVKRKRAGQTLHKRLTGGSAPLSHPAFDGYHVSFHCLSVDGHDVLVLLERHEATALATFICREVENQRCRIADQVGAMQQLELGEQKP